MRPRRTATAAEQQLFTAAMKGVKPLAAERRELVRPKPVEAPPRPPTIRLPPLPADPNPGLDRGTETRLRRGKLPIDRTLDLHGMTQTAAHAALDRALAHARAAGERVLLVVTGKGGIDPERGVLRRMVPLWLASGPHAGAVLRVTSARIPHGGSGAYYVLLRRRREGPRR